MIVNVASLYIHALEGRLRIKVSEIKGALARALEIERRLSAIEGIDRVKANPTTGNVLILYNSCKIAQHEIVDRLLSWGYLQERHKPALGRTEVATTRLPLREALAETLVRSTMELAFQGLIRALI